MQSDSQGNLSLPSGPNFHSSRPSPGPSQRRKSWQSQRISIRSGRSASYHGSPPPAESLRREQTHASTQASSSKSEKWWRVRLFRGMLNDVKRRAPYYWSDWADAWDYRIVPATVYMFFAKYVGRFILVSRRYCLGSFIIRDLLTCSAASCLL